METILNKESRAVIELMVADGIIAKDTAERYFPELKESEDENVRNFISNELMCLRAVECNSGGKDSDRYNELTEALAWLEERGKQKPADTEKGANGNDREIPNSVWSEADEKLLELSVDNLTELKNRFGKEYGRTGDCIDWLKSLKERYTWKPSEEQINALSYYIKYDVDNEGIFGHQLVKLYQDLKKLREGDV